VDNQISLSTLTETQAKIALQAVDYTYERALEFVHGLHKQSQFEKIIEEAFDIIDEIVRARHENQMFPTNLDAISKLFSVMDKLEAGMRDDPKNEITYDAVFDYIKSARIIAFKPAEEIAGKTPMNLRDLAMNQADIPKERLY
jgi:hypothetical protein